MRLALLGLAFVAACRQKPAPPAPAIITPPATASAVTAPPSPDWTTPIETLIVRDEVPRIEQTQTHILWLDIEPHAPSQKATLLGVAKARPQGVLAIAEDVPAERLFTSASHAFMVDGVARAFIIDPTTKKKTAVTLPPETSANALDPLFAGSGDTLYFASFTAPAGWKLWTVTAATKARSFASGKGALGRLAGTPEGVLVSEESGANEIVLLRAPQRARSEATTAIARPAHIDALAPSGTTLVWSDFEAGDAHDRTMTIRAVVPGGPPRVLATMQSPRQLGANRTRACWAVYGGISDSNAQTSVWCVPLAGGALERAVGPLDQRSIHFALDDAHLYWSETNGDDWKLRRRPLP